MRPFAACVRLSISRSILSIAKFLNRNSLSMAYRQIFAEYRGAPSLILVRCTIRSVRGISVIPVDSSRSTVAVIAGGAAPVGLLAPSLDHLSTPLAPIGGSRCQLAVWSLCVFLGTSGYNGLTPRSDCTLLVYPLVYQQCAGISCLLAT